MSLPADVRNYARTVTTGSNTPDLAAIPLLVHGRTWEEMTLGFAFRTSGRTITEADVQAFVALAGVNEPLFLDARVAAEAGYSGRLVPGMMTFSFAEGLVIQSGSIHGTGLAFLGTDLTIHAPVYVGDTITVVVEVVEQRATSKGGRGVITTRNQVFNQDGVVVMTYTPARLTKGRDT
jgi:acyl dehydratase